MLPCFKLSEGRLYTLYSKYFILSRVSSLERYTVVTHYTHRIFLLLVLVYLNQPLLYDSEIGLDWIGLDWIRFYFYYLYRYLCIFFYMLIMLMWDCEIYLIPDRKQNRYHKYCILRMRQRRRSPRLFPFIVHFIHSVHSITDDSIWYHYQYIHI